MFLVDWWYSALASLGELIDSIAHLNFKNGERSCKMIFRFCFDFLAQTVLMIERPVSMRLYSNHTKNDLHYP